MGLRFAVSPPWPATTWPTAEPAPSPRPSPPSAGAPPAGRGADPRLPGRRGLAGHHLRARPDVLNHNIETVPRLQRAVRPSAKYARSLAVLARAKEAGLVTKSGSSWAWARPTTRWSPPWPTCAASASTSSRSASTCAPPPTTCRWPGGSSRRRSTSTGGRRGDGHPARRVEPAHLVELPRPRRPARRRTRPRPGPRAYKPSRPRPPPAGAGDARDRSPPRGTR